MKQQSVGSNVSSKYTNLIVCDLTRTGLELTTYLTLGEHANHYTIDSVRMVDRFTNIYIREWMWSSGLGRWT